MADINEEVSEDLEDIEERTFDLEIKGSMFFATFCFVLVYFAYLIYFYFVGDKTLVPDSSAWGQFGDFVGGVLNPIVAGLAFFWLVKSMRMQRDEVRSTRVVLGRSAEQQRKQSRLIRKQNQIAELQVSANIELATLEALRTERMGLISRIIQGNSNVEHSVYKSDLGQSPKLIEVVQQLDAEISLQTKNLEGIQAGLKKINSVSNMEQMIETVEDAGFY